MGIVYGQSEEEVNCPASVPLEARTMELTPLQRDSCRRNPKMAVNDGGDVAHGEERVAAVEDGCEGGDEGVWASLSLSLNKRASTLGSFPREYSLSFGSERTSHSWTELIIKIPHMEGISMWPSPVPRFDWVLGSRTDPHLQIWPMFPVMGADARFRQLSGVFSRSSLP